MEAVYGRVEKTVNETLAGWTVFRLECAHDSYFSGHQANHPKVLFY